MRTLAIDLETYSELDIKKVGTYKYAANCEILLCAYTFDDETVEIVDLACGESLPAEFIDALFDSKVLKTAYNAQFEIQVLSKYFGRELDTSQWQCTMVLGLSLGLPAGLEQLGKVLNLTSDKRKLTAGKKLIGYFSKPCSKTQSAGLWDIPQQMRNLPQNNLDKWKAFKEYCKQDVETERFIRRKLEKFLPTNFEKKLWCLDQKINSNGVLIDLKLVDRAIEIDTLIRSKALHEGAELTGGLNINSNQQMLDWVEEQEGWRPSSFDKAARAEIKPVNHKVQKMLELRNLISKTSVKKYETMRETACDDDRARGMFQFYGANRTGRWAGRLIQLQNLPQNHLDDLDIARQYVRDIDIDMFFLFYDKPSEVLSQLVRTAFIAEKGSRFIVADFSAIEARVIAWLADEKWRMKVFAEGGDIYCASASEMFKVPVEKHGINKELRQKGKIAELACIAEGELVLTDKGLIPIEEITLEHKIWDGEEWVSHEGVIYKGEKEVITYDGLTATPDHLVWIEGQSKPVYFGVAATCGARLLQTGNDRTAIRLGKNYQLRKTLEQSVESLLCVDAMHKLRSNTMAKLEQFNQRKIKRLSKLLSTTPNSIMVGSKINRRKTTLRKSERQGLSQLRCSGNQILLFFGLRSGIVDYKKSWFTSACYGNRSYQQQWSLCGRQFTFCFSYGKQFKQTNYCINKVQPSRVAIYLCDGDTKIVTGANKGRNYSRRRKNGDGETKKLAHHRRKVKVYDILNAGKRHCFTVSGKLVHNCGYGGGTGALKAFGADKMGLSDEEMQSIIEKWRLSSPNICKLWRDVESAAKNAVQFKRPFTCAKGIIYEVIDNFLFATLPSGRKIAYYKPSVEDNQLKYEGSLQAAGGWGINQTWGGKLVENLVQAIARDCLAKAMLRMDAAGYKIVMHVHDEIICEMPNGQGSLAEMIEIMRQPIKSLDGLILNADGYETEYYRKD